MRELGGLFDEDRIIRFMAYAVMIFIAGAAIQLLSWILGQAAWILWEVSTAITIGSVIVIIGGLVMVLTGHLITMKRDNDWKLGLNHGYLHAVAFASATAAAVGSICLVYTNQDILLNPPALAAFIIGWLALCLYYWIHGLVDTYVVQEVVLAP